MEYTETRLAETCISDMTRSHVYERLKMLTIDISSQNTYLWYTSKHDKVLLLIMQLEDVTRK
jgi:hypothetical protein